MNGIGCTFPFIDSLLLQIVNNPSKHKVKPRHLPDEHQLLPDGQYKQLKNEQESVIATKQAFSPSS